MKCDLCKSDSKVINVAKCRRETYRLRECKSCGNRFYTVEQKCDESDGYAAIKQIRNFNRNRIRKESAPNEAKS